MMKQGDDSDNLVAVWRLPDEQTGLLLREVLADQGIRSDIHSDQVAWMDHVMTTAQGYWGRLLVLSSDAARAKEIIEAYNAESAAGAD